LISSAFKGLFTEARIGKIKLKNRLIMAPMVMCYAGPFGEVNSQVLAHFEACARGGVGLIIAEASYIHPTGKGFESEIALDNDKLIPRLRMLTKAVQVHDCAIAAQLYHGGIQANIEQPVGPSAIGRKAFPPKKTPRELSTIEVEEIVVSFVEGALRAKKAGFDMVEVHGTHGYLIAQFLSPLTNKRSDKYGADKNLLAIEIVTGIKQKCGQDFPVIFRLSTNDYEEGGITLESAKKLAVKLESIGVNALDVTAATYDTADQIIPPAYYDKQGYFFEQAAEIKKVVNIPIISGGMIFEPKFANQAIEQETVDFLFLGRQIIADPNWPNLVKEGKNNEIRPCIACEECIERIFNQTPVNCSVNPLKGFEYKYPTEKDIGKVASPGKVVIIGGGVAGLEAARTASMKGYEVIVFEETNALGGVLKIVLDQSHKRRIKRLIEYYETLLKRYGVTIRMGTKANFETITKEDPDLVILATGAEPIIPENTETKDVILAEDVLSGKVDVGDSVIIIGGGLVGCELALKLSSIEEKNVTIVEALPEVAMDEVTLNKLALTKLLNQVNAKILTNTPVVEISKDGVTIVDSMGKKQRLNAKTVILAVGRKSKVDQDLLKSLKDNGKEVFVIGDAKQPRNIISAVHSGFWTVLNAIDKKESSRIRLQSNN
jgi:2,4-dienoyl-CoA reductase-like NADH-dependent reductase (Old Yellow Enzyme family)/thioredoxin reductase